MTEIGYTQVLIALSLVAVAIIVAKFWRLPVKKDMAIGSVRAFVQLVALGYALEYIFALDSVPALFGVLLIMALIGGHTAAGHVKDIKGSFWITFIAIASGSILTIGSMLALDIITLEAKFVIPLGGMIIGNSMNAASLTASRVNSDIRNQKAKIESALALGKTWRQATMTMQKEAAVAGMISILNFLKTAGLVALPGAMTGMILAGISPLKAVLLQILVGYMLLCAVTVTSVIALELTIRRFFSPHHQLITPES